MLGILLNACVLMALLKVINDEDAGFGMSALVALGTSIGALVLGIVFVEMMGSAGFIVAALLTAALLAIAVAAIFAVELKRACLISVLFMAINIGISLGFEMMFQA